MVVTVDWSGGAAVSRERVRGKRVVLPSPVVGDQRSIDLVLVQCIERN